MPDGVRRLQVVGGPGVLTGAVLCHPTTWRTLGAFAVRSGLAKGAPGSFLSVGGSLARPSRGTKRAERAQGGHMAICQDDPASIVGPDAGPRRPDQDARSQRPDARSLGPALGPATTGRRWVRPRRSGRRLSPAVSWPGSRTSKATLRPCLQAAGMSHRVPWSGNPHPSPGTGAPRGIRSAGRRRSGR